MVARRAHLAVVLLDALLLESVHRVNRALLVVAAVEEHVVGIEQLQREEGERDLNPTIAARRTRYGAKDLIRPERSSR